MVMKFFPNFILKNRYLNKLYRITIAKIYNKYLIRFEPNSPISLERLGSNYGGWFIPAQEITSEWIIYSAGVGTDTSFDIELIERFGCIVYGFDPTDAANEHVNRRRGKSAAFAEKFVFERIGLWDEDEDVKFFAPKTGARWVGSYSALNLQGTGEAESIIVPCRSLSTIMKSLGHERIDLLKIDIEGAEYGVLADIMRRGLSVDWLCVEFDQPVPIWTTKAMLRQLKDRDYVLQKVDNWNLTFAHRRVLERARTETD